MAIALTDETSDDYARIKREGWLAYQADKPGLLPPRELSLHARKAWSEGWVDALRQDWGLQ